MESMQKTILKNGTAISSQEALADITPIDWSKDVLDGKYRDKAIVKYDEKEVVEICKKYGIETVEKEGYPLYQGREMDENFSIVEIMREPVTIVEDDKKMEKEIKYNMQDTVYSFKKKIGLFGSMWKNIR